MLTLTLPLPLTPGNQQHHMLLMSYEAPAGLSAGPSAWLKSAAVVVVVPLQVGPPQAPGRATHSGWSAKPLTAQRAARRDRKAKVADSAAFLPHAGILTLTPTLTPTLGMMLLPGRGGGAACLLEHAFAMRRCLPRESAEAGS